MAAGSPAGWWSRWARCVPSGVVRVADLVRVKWRLLSVLGRLLGGHLLDDHLPDGHLPFVQEEVAVVRGSGAYDAGLRSARPNRRA
ncbi:hypothetical protein GCM10010320_01450 [Streptomyces caelestis]|nr:hypothetical protein GCM10010320_01450 [Streptomyces caelestis]